MAWRNEILMRDVTNACLVISNCINRDVVSQLDLEVALEALAAHVLERLAERRFSDEGDTPTLEQRHHYLSNAVLQAKSATNAEGMNGPARASLDNELLDLLEGKLAVLQFQIKIKVELEAIASSLEATPSTSESVTGESQEENNVSSTPDLIWTI